MHFDCLVVGAGLAGSTIAERLASKLNMKILLTEKRNHIGGNTFDFYNSEGILVKKYGPHIFHTNNDRVWEYTKQFTKWNSYVHRVIAKVNGKEVYLPISIDTLENLYGKSFSIEEMKQFLESRKIACTEIRNSRDVVVSQVGTEFYELFFKNYTKKLWGRYPEELDAQVTKRLPVRYNRDTRYFTDTYQGIPVDGFTSMFTKLLQNKNIKLLLNTEYQEIAEQVKTDLVIYTGPIDEYFGFEFGKLPYRSLRFVFETYPLERYQNAAVVNYPNEQEYIRVTEFKHFYFQQHQQTTVCYEYPSENDDDPYYPIPDPKCQALYTRYKEKAEKLENVYFTGRLAQYQYLNMDQVILNSLELFDRINDEYGN